MARTPTIILTEKKPRTFVVPGKRKGAIVKLRPKRHRFTCHAKLRTTGVDIHAGGKMLAGITEREALELHASLSKIRSRIAWTIKRWDL